MNFSFLENLIFQNKEDIGSFKLNIYDFWNESRQNILFDEENEDFQNFLYMAPEAFAVNNTNKVYFIKKSNIFLSVFFFKNGDIWSLGVILSLFFTKGVHLFYEPTQTFKEYLFQTKTKTNYLSADFPSFL